MPEESHDRRRTRPIAMVDIEAAILDDIERMEKETEVFEDLCVAEARTKVKYKVGHAAAYLRASGTQKDKEAHANFLTEELALDAEIAAARVKYGREKLQTLRAELDGHRSLNSNVRTQV